MNNLSKCSLVAMVGAVVVGASSAQPEPGALPAETALASLVAASSCPYDDAATPLAMGPMCNYLAKCCSGGTDNAQKCCAAYLQKC